MMECKKSVDELRLAIIRRTVEDYKNLQRRKANGYKTCGHMFDYPGKKIDEEERSLERFFLSEWFEFLSGTDGAAFYKKLKKEYGV